MNQDRATAAIKSLERVLQKHAHLAPEFAMLAAQEWADNYVPMASSQHVMFVQPSTLQQFNDGLTENLILHRKSQFPFTHPVEVSI